MFNMRVFVGWRAGVFFGATFLVFVSYSIGSFLRRMSEMPRDYTELGAALLLGNFICTFISAGAGAYVTSRNRRRLTPDLWLTSSRGPTKRLTSIFLAVYLPFASAWAIFFGNAAIQFGRGSGGVEFIGIFAMSFLACGTGVSLGILIGSILPGVLAVPSAMGLGYFVPLVYAGASDETRYQGLGTAFGSDLPSHYPVIWLIGCSLWYFSVSFFLITCSSFFAGTPRKVPFKHLSLAILGLIIGVFLVQWGASFDNSITISR